MIGINNVPISIFRSCRLAGGKTADTEQKAELDMLTRSYLRTKVVRHRQLELSSVLCAQSGPFGHEIENHNGYHHQALPFVTRISLRPTIQYFVPCSEERDYLDRGHRFATGSRDKMNRPELQPPLRFREPDVSSMFYRSALPNQGDQFQGRQGFQRS